MTMRSHSRHGRDDVAHGGGDRCRLRGPAHGRHLGAFRPPGGAGRARRRPAWPRCAAGKCPSSRPDWTSWWPRASLARHPALYGLGRRGGARAPSSCSCACRRHRVTTGRPTCPTWSRRRKKSGAQLMPGAIVVNKSTVPVGSATMVEEVIGRPDVRVVSNPEFLREGSAVQDSLHPDRLVVGADDAQGGRSGRRFVRRHRCAPHRHRCHHVRDDQVRLQRLLGHQAELRQCRRRPLRRGGSRRTRCDARTGVRQAHRF